MQVFTFMQSRRITRFVGAGLAALCFMPVQAAPKFVELDVPYVPTPPAAVAKMLEMAKVGPNDHVIDLGSGDGRIAIAAVRDRQAKKALGVDIDPARVSEAEDNARRDKVEDRVRFLRQDLFDTDISKASVVTMYLLPDVNIKMRPVILDTLAPGSRVVSHSFTMGDWQSDQDAFVDGRSLFMWIVPAKVGGTWKVDQPQGGFTLNFRQDFQKLEAQAQRNGEPIAVSQATLRGTELRFTIDEDGTPRHYVGTVRGDLLVAADEAGAHDGWRATRLTP